MLEYLPTKLVESIFFSFKVELSGSMSLTEANEKYWKVNKPMEMFYSFQRS